MHWHKGLKTLEAHELLLAAIFLYAVINLNMDFYT